MEIAVNEYFMPYDKDPAPVEMYPNNIEAANILNRHKSTGRVVISMADCLPNTTIRLPMPDELWKHIDNRLNEQDEHIIVIGIDAYLSLLSESNVEAFFVALTGRILDIKKVTFLLSKQYRHYFTTPKYEESKRIVVFAGIDEIYEPPSITVVSDRWINPDDMLTDYNSLLIRLGDTIPKGSHTLVIKNLTNSQAGLSNSVTFMLNAHQIVERFYNITSDLEKSTLEQLLDKTRDNHKSPEGYLETEFGEANFDLRFALKRLKELPDDELWPAFVWLLRKRLPADSYLSKVLESDVTFKNVLRKYAVDALTSIIYDNKIERYANERAEALSGISAESLIAEFVNQTKDIEPALRFLNCKTTAEFIEIIRRASKLDLSIGLPELYKKLYPALSDYLNFEYEYPSDDLSYYFKEYRILKITNTITESFAKQAFEAKLPESCPSRDALLAELQKGKNTALLVVDGMGAEYLPLLLSMASNNNMNIESYTVAAVKLPTSTEYNRTSWSSERCVASIKMIDTIAHEGAAKHENNPPERNIYKALQAFEEVFVRVANEFERFDRIVVTADHGSSRLAVLAHKNGLSEDLEWEGNPLDWRYSFAPKDKERQHELEQQYHPDRDNGKGELYWIVRGYNRLPKRGPKLYELHGGASLEERLVPVIVFSKTKSTLQQKQIPRRSTEQIIDRIGFEDI